MKSYILSFSILFLLFSCNKENPIVEDPGPNDPVQTESVKSGNIDFSNLQKGQTSLYKKYEYVCSNTLDETIYSPDVLEVKVIDDTEDFTFREIYHYTEQDYADTAIYKVKSENGNILIPERGNSYLFFFYGNDTLNLTATTFTTMEQGNCNIMKSSSVFLGDEIGLIPSFDVFDMHNKDKIVVSCVPFVELQAYLMYDRKQLFTSYVHWISEFMGNVTETVNGYQLIND